MLLGLNVANFEDSGISHSTKGITLDNDNYHVLVKLNGMCIPGSLQY